MTSGLVIVYAVTSAAMALAFAAALALGYASEKRARRTRFVLILFMLGALASVYAAQAFDISQYQQQIFVRADTRPVNLWRYVLHTVVNTLFAPFVVLALTSELLIAGFAAAGGLAVSLPLLFGAWSVGIMTWVWVVFAGAALVLLAAFYFLYVQQDENSQNSAMQRMLARIAGIAVPTLCAFLYVFDKPLLHMMSQFWGGMSFAMLDGVIVAAALYLFYRVDAEPEASSIGMQGLLGTITAERAAALQQQQHLVVYAASPQQAQYGGGHPAAQVVYMNVQASQQQHHQTPQGMVPL